MQTFSFRLCWATFTLLATAQAVTVASGLETVQIGPYYAKNCKSNNQKISTLLETLSYTLQPVIRDAGSPSSSDAYKTFFKNVAYAPYVRKVFSNIATGASVPPEPGAPSVSPVFICVDGRHQVTYLENGILQDAYISSRTHGWAALALLKRPEIVINTKLFFNYPAIPVQSTANCLTVNPRLNYFVQNGLSLVKYQLWTILHELVHYYVWSTKEFHRDVYAINRCLDLISRDAVVNAESYVYYAANIRLGCTNFPTVRARPPGRGRGGGIELLEIDANSTALSANESVAPVVQNVSIAAAPLAQAPAEVSPNSTSRR